MSQMTEQPQENQVHVESTRRMDLGEMKAKGKWVVDNVFSIGGSWMYLNGNLVPNTEAGGWIVGRMTGHPLFSCGFCGMTISEHYTVRCIQTGEVVNVGNKCVVDIVGESSIAIIQAVESLKRKVESEYKRNVHNEQLRTWLTENLVELDRLQKEHLQNQIDQIKVQGFYEESVTEFIEWTEDEIAKWEAEPRNKGMKRATKRSVWVTKQIFERNIKTRINLKGEEEAIEYYNPDFSKHVNRIAGGMDYWLKTHEKYSRINWNPRTMLTSFKETIGNYNTHKIILPKLRKLTEKERLEIKQSQQQQVDAYMLKIKKIQESQRK